MITNRFSSSRDKWKPTTRVDIFDRFEELMRGVDRVKIGEVLTDGRQGRVEIQSDRFREELTRLFSEPLFIFQGGGQGPGGERFDAGTTLPPWRMETLEHLVAYELHVRNLRGEIVSLTPDARFEE